MQIREFLTQGSMENLDEGVMDFISMFYAKLFLRSKISVKREQCPYLEDFESYIEYYSTQE